MSGRLFDDLDRVDMTRGPADGSTAPSGVNWQRQPSAPVSGTTPGAKHASATGAMLASSYSGARAQELAIAFYEHGRLTIAEAAVILNIKEGSVTGPWNRLEHELGWIEGLREYFTWQNAAGRTVKREYHRLTSDGARIAAVLAQQKATRVR